MRGCEYDESGGIGDDEGEGAGAATRACGRTNEREWNESRLRSSGRLRNGADLCCVEPGRRAWVEPQPQARSRAGELEGRESRGRLLTTRRYGEAGEG